VTGLRYGVVVEPLGVVHEVHIGGDVGTPTLDALSHVPAGVSGSGEPFPDPSLGCDRQ
jgi:hypothetical protein